MYTMNGKDIKLIFGTSVKNTRKAKGITQEKLAELIGKDKNTVNRIETGLNFVTGDTYAALCNALNVQPNILMTQQSDLYLKENIDWIRIITQLLQTFPPEKLEEAYNILNVLNK